VGAEELVKEGLFDKVALKQGLDGSDRKFMQMPGRGGSF
jgi:hypothetical protein